MGVPYLFFDHGVVAGEPYATLKGPRTYFRDLGFSDDSIDTVFSVLAKHPFDPRAAPSADDPLWPHLEKLARTPGVDFPEARRQLVIVSKAYEDYSAELLRNRNPYSDIHHILMALWYFGLLVVTVSNLRLLGYAPAWALLLLLPATLFFGFNRFDLVVTCLVGLIFNSHMRKRPRLTGLLLGVAIMVKWYPLVLVPLILAHGTRRDRAEREAQGQPAPWWPALVRQVVVPGAILGAFCFAMLAITWSWHGGGLDAVSFVLDWHLHTRVPNHASALTLLTEPIRLGWIDQAYQPMLGKLFLGLQLLLPFGLALVPIRNRHHLLEGCLAVTIGMALYSKFFSPQWVIWITAIAILLAPRYRIYLVFLVALELVIYLQLPLYYYAFGLEDPSFWVVTYVRLGLFAAFWLFTLGSFLVHARPPRVEA